MTRIKFGGLFRVSDQKYNKYHWKKLDWNFKPMLRACNTIFSSHCSLLWLHSHSNHLIVPLPSLKVRKSMSLTGSLISICWGVRICKNPSHFSYGDINEQNLFKWSHCKESKACLENVNPVLEPGAVGVHPWLQAVGEDLSGSSTGKPRSFWDNLSCQESMAFNSAAYQPLKMPECVYLLVNMIASPGLVWKLSKETIIKSIKFKVGISWDGDLANKPSVPCLFHCSYCGILSMSWPWT